MTPPGKRETVAMNQPLTAAQTLLSGECSGSTESDDSGVLDGNNRCMIFVKLHRRFLSLKWAPTRWEAAKQRQANEQKGTGSQ